MPPSSARRDAPHRVLRNVVAPSYRPLRLAGLKQCANLYDLVLAELGYAEGLDMVVEGDDEEVTDILAAVVAIERLPWV